RTRIRRYTRGLYQGFARQTRERLRPACGQVPRTTLKYRQCLPRVSMFSKIAETGIRVPLRTQAPLTLPGTLDLAGNAFNDGAFRPIQIGNQEIDLAAAISQITAQRLRLHR